MKKPKFGDRIKVDHKLVRKEKYIGTQYPVWKKYWQEKQIDPCECIFLGVRYLTNGRCFADHTYQYDEQIKAFLVCKNEHENPFYFIP